MSTVTDTRPAPSGLAGYLQEVRKEMRKVNWPKRQELISNTVLTLVSALALGVFIFGADQAISWVLSQVYGA